MTRSLPTIELSRFNRSALTRAALVIVAIIPAFYAGLYLSSTQNPVDHLDALPAVIVNHDRPAKAEGETIDAGAELVDELSSSDESYDWVEATATEADAGLANGTYFAELDIPADFSSSIASATTDAPHRAKLTVYSDDATSYIIGQVTNTVSNGIQNSLNEKITSQYLDNVYIGFNELHSSIADAATGAHRLARGSATASDGADDLVVGLAALDTGAQKLASAAADLSSGASTLSAGASDLSDGVSSLAGSTHDLSAGAAEVAAAAQHLSAAVPAGPLAQPLAELAAGTSQVGGGAAKLDGAVSTQLVPGAAELARGASSLATGAASVDAGARQLASGAAAADEGAGQLATGVSKLETGSKKLANGLSDGVKEIPTYSAAERSKLADVEAKPMEATREHRNAVDEYAQGLAPYFIPLALWIGGMVAFMVMRPLSPRGLASSANPVKVALAGYLPGALFGAIQAAILVGVLEVVIGVHSALPGWSFVFGAVVAVVFMAIHQAFVAFFGGVGRLAALVLLMVQLPSASGTYPVETSPAFFQAISSWLPMTFAVQGFRQVIAGGSGAIAAAAVGHLFVFGLLAFAITVLAAHRNRSWSVKRLHPALSL